MSEENVAPTSVSLPDPVVTDRSSRTPFRSWCSPGGLPNRRALFRPPNQTPIAGRTAYVRPFQKHVKQEIRS